MVPAIEEEGRVARVVEHGRWEVQQQNKQLLHVREKGKGKWQYVSALGKSGILGRECL